MKRQQCHRRFQSRNVILDKPAQDRIGFCYDFTPLQPTPLPKQQGCP